MRGAQGPSTRDPDSALDRTKGFLGLLGRLGFLWLNAGTWSGERKISGICPLLYLGLAKSHPRLALNVRASALPQVAGITGAQHAQAGSVSEVLCLFCAGKGTHGPFPAQRVLTTEPSPSFTACYFVLQTPKEDEASGDPDALHPASSRPPLLGLG